MWWLWSLAIIIFFFWIRRVSKKAERLEGELTSLRDTIAGLEQKLVSDTAQVDTPSQANDNAPTLEKAPEPDAEPVGAMAAATETASAEKRAEAPRKRRSFADIEQLVGARWSVILGGIAIALGALFLVRYSIEAGLLGPGARIFLGFLVSLALLVGGEWLRRNDKAKQIPVVAKADIPGVLTGAGIVAAFGTLFAAHGLYGFVGPAVSFIGLTVIGLASLALSAVHGPRLAAIGIVGAYAAPLPVDSETPSYLAMTLHILVVTGSAMGVARIRSWLWLTIAGIAGSMLWALVLLIPPLYSGLYPLILLAGLATIYIGTQCWERLPIDRPPEDGRFAITANFSLAILAFMFVLYCAGSTDFPVIIGAIVVGGLMMGASVYWTAMAPAALSAALVAVAAGVTHQLDLQNMPAIVSIDNIAADITPPDMLSYLGGLISLGGVLGFIGLYGVRQQGATAPRSAGLVACGIAVIGVLVSIAAYLRISLFDQHLSFGAAAIALAGVFVALSEFAIRLRPQDLKAGAPAAFAVAAIALISFALGVMLTSQWWPFGLALTSLGIVWVFKGRPLRVLPWLAIIVAALSTLSLWANAPFAAQEIGTIPFLNGLILIVGLPAGVVLLGGEMLRRHGEELTGAILTAIGLFLLALFVGLELRHWTSGGDIVGARFGLLDMGVQASAALGFAIGLQRVARFTGASIFTKASWVVGILSVIAIIMGLMVFHNPFLTHMNIGDTPIFNELLPGYLIPGALAAIVAYMARPVRPRWYTLSYAFLAALILFTYFTLQTRQFFQGGEVGFFEPTGDVEFWIYSAVWLALGGVLLAVGLFFQSMPLRLASGLLIGLTILKVFLLDMTELTGVLRAVSFIGLGLCLIGIGRFYQRILVSQSPQKSKDDESQEA